ncbi:MAG TPA: hypothetical protein VF669_05660 [Tepidisphaeraceae bacterium]
MSKLPRLSNTADNTPPPRPDETLTAPIPATPTDIAEPAMTRGQLLGAEVWLSAVLGIIFMLFGKNFGLYLFSKIANQTYHTGVNWTEGPLAGQEVAYPELMGFVMLTDASLFLFGLALLFEAIVLGASASAKGLRKPLVYLAFGISILAIAFNLFACGRMMAAGITPIISLLATAFGVYVAMYEWALIRSMRS